VGKPGDALARLVRNSALLQGPEVCDMQQNREQAIRHVMAPFDISARNGGSRILH
jgi:hypothetical protein